MAQQLSFARDITESICAALAADQMPCDGAWPDEDVERFRSWLDTARCPSVRREPLAPWWARVSG
jgi:hypothetical protein